MHLDFRGPLSVKSVGGGGGVVSIILGVSGQLTIAPG